MEGELIINYIGEKIRCDDFINTLLMNGYALSIQLINEGKNLKILYCR